MSARAPFVPGSRPASRAAHLQDQPEPAKKSFSPDLANSLNANTGGGKLFPKLAQASSKAEDENAANSNPPRNQNKPLNTGSLLRRKNNALASDTPNRRGSMQKTPTEVAARNTTSPDLQVKGAQHDGPGMLEIIAPVPRQPVQEDSLLLHGATAVGANAQTPMKTPLSGSTLMNAVSTESRSEKKAHIVTSTAAPYSSQTPIQEHSPCQLPSPPISARIPNSRVFEGMQPNIGRQNPGRVRLDRNGMPRMDDSFGQFDKIMPYPASPQSVALPVKRAHPTHEEYDGYTGRYGTNAKRHRGQENEFMGRDHPSSPHDEYLEPTNFGSPSPEDGSRSRHAYALEQRPPTPHVPLFAQPSEEGPTSSQPLDAGTGIEAQFSRTSDRLLECNVDEFFENRLDQYEKMLARWRECTTEEWMAGAKEHTERWAKLLEFIKKHITAKVQVFADLDHKVKAHNNLLDEREDTLARVKEQLLEKCNDFCL